VKITTESEIPKLIHFIWLGSDPGSRLLREIERIRELNPDWEVRLWRDGDLDWLKNQRWFDSVSAWAGRADVARYEIVHRYGGFYVDADFSFLRPMRDMNLTGDLVVVKERQDLVCNAFFGARAGHPFMARLVERVGGSIEGRPGVMPQETSGPVFFTEQLMQWSAGTAGEWSEIERDLIFPYSFDKLDHGSGPWSPDVIAVHAWSQARHGLVRVNQSEVVAGPPRVTHLRMPRGVASRVRVKANAVRRAIRSALWCLRTTSLGSRELTIDRRGRAVITDRADRADRVTQRHRVGLGPIKIVGAHDLTLHRFLSARLSGSDVYVDVGADTGQFVDTAARTLSSYGRVFAYEPNPRIAETLSLNVEMWRSVGARAEIIERRFAISDSNQPVTLRIPMAVGDHGAAQHGTHDAIDESGFEHHEVACRSLDDELGHLSRIRLIKVDAMGGEAEVLDGSAALVESGRVDFFSLVLASSQPGSGLVRLGSVLDRWQDSGAKFAGIDPRGTLVPLEGRASSILASEELKHLVIDLQPIRLALLRQAGEAGE